MEAWGLGTFMVSACLFTIVFEHPDLKVVQLIPSPFIRRLFIGLAMGLTAVGIIYSPWGIKSGAHLNPSVSLTMLFIKKISFIDAIFYILFQTIGGSLGVLILKFFIPTFLSHPSINYIITIPGKAGLIAAVFGECIISFILMCSILIMSNSRCKRMANFTGIFAGFLIMCFVTFESPYSGMSMNPARTIASAIAAGIWKDCWIYFLGPPLSMLIAAYLYKLWNFKESQKLSDIL